MYKPLAKYYDVLQAQIQYESWIDFVSEYLKKEDEILEVGCGTATLAKKITDMGYNVFATDYSQDMINIAKTKVKNTAVMDITNTKIDKQYDAVICFMDVINYLTTEEKLISAFSNISQFLKPGGIFMFDVQHQTNIEYFDQYHEERSLLDTVLTWDSTYLGDNLVMHHLDFGKEGSETQYQRFMLPQYYLALLKPYFKNCEVFQDNYRVYFVCRKD